MYCVYTVNCARRLNLEKKNSKRRTGQNNLSLLYRVVLSYIFLCCFECVYERFPKKKGKEEWRKKKREPRAVFSFSFFVVRRLFCSLRFPSVSSACEFTFTSFVVVVYIYRVCVSHFVSLLYQSLS